MEIKSYKVGQAFILKLEYVEYDSNRVHVTLRKIKYEADTPTNKCVILSMFEKLLRPIISSRGHTLTWALHP